MSEAENFNVEADRLNFLKELRERVDDAIANRKRIRVISSGRTDIGSASKSGRQGSILAKLHGNRKVNLNTAGEDEPYEVRVDNPHDYKELLEYSLGKILTLDKAKRETEETLRHEFEHHVPGLGEHGLQMKYCVSFLEDTETGEVFVAPYINLSGSTRTGVVRKILDAPNEKSRTDEIFLRKK